MEDLAISSEWKKRVRCEVYKLNKKRAASRAGEIKNAWKKNRLVKHVFNFPGQISILNFLHFPGVY